MIILTVTAEKGGVGKSTTAVNLAARWAISGHSVGLLDLDKQGNATMGLGVEPDGSETTEALATKGPLTAYMSEYGVAVIPGGEGLTNAPDVLGRYTVPQKVLQKCIEASAFDLDVLIIDTSPNITERTNIAALVAGTHYLIPTQCKGWSVAAVGKVVDVAVDLSDSFADAPELVGILPTMYQHTRESRTSLEALREDWGDDVLDTLIRERTVVSASMSDGLPISAHAPGSDGDLDYQAAAAELAGRLGL